MSAAALAAIIIAVTAAAIPAVVAMVVAAPPRRPDPAAGRASALIGLRGWHGCCVDAAGRTVWVDPVARRSATEALAAADVEMQRAGGAR